MGAGEDGGATGGALDDGDAVFACGPGIQLGLGLADAEDEGGGGVAVPAQCGWRLAGGDVSPEGLREGELLLGRGDVEWEHTPADHGRRGGSFDLDADALRSCWASARLSAQDDGPKGSLRAGWGNGSFAVLRMTDG